MPIAITGGIAEGKSTVLDALKEMGAKVGSADVVARDIFNDPETNKRLSSLASFDSNQITPEQLRVAISSSPALRRKVNSLMHPLIMYALSSGQFDFVEVPLLIEVCAQSNFSEVWVVTCGRDMQLQRLRERYSESQVFSILGTQLDTRIKASFADAIVPTDGSLGQTCELLKKEVKRVGLPLVV